ncbi:MAG: hypothetical protein ACK559_35355, partial [bacterium]
MVPAVVHHQVHSTVRHCDQPPGSVAIQGPMDRLGEALLIPWSTLRTREGLGAPSRDEENGCDNRPPRTQTGRTFRGKERPGRQ